MTMNKPPWLGTLTVSLALVAAACSTAGGTDTTVLPTTVATTTSPTTTVQTTAATTSVQTTAATTTVPTTAATTTVPTTAATTTSPTTTVPTTVATTTTTTAVVADVVAMGTFDFASGADPQVNVTVKVGTAAEGPWVAAGREQSPEITGPELWILFTIENRDFRGPMTELVISGTEDGPLEANVCRDQAPIAASASELCVVGPLTVEIGPQSIGFAVTASGEGQPAGNGDWFTPPIEPPGYLGAPTSFVFAFETSELPREGLLIEGHASGTTVDVDIPGELVATISLDCADPGAGSGLTLVVYSITAYDVDGIPSGGCETISTVALNYTLDDLSDTSVNYTGS